MKITDADISRPGSVAAKKAEKAGSANKAKSDAAGSSSQNPTDRVEVSSAQADVELFKVKLPDVRAEVVAALKLEVESGTYHREAKDIADAIIREVQKYGQIGAA